MRPKEHPEGASTHLDDHLLGQRLSVEQIPVIDFAPFLGTSYAERKRVALEIGRACRDIGFFYIVRHGVSEALIDRMFAEAKRFFVLPPERKREIAIEKSSCHRGWYPLGAENLDPEKQKQFGDYKEGIQIGRDLPPDDPLVRAKVPLHGPNQWPTGLPGWKETILEGHAELTRLGRVLLHSFALALELPETWFDRWATAPLTVLGLLHYPPQPGHITEACIGAGAHTDWGGLTILAQDAVGGLQVRNSAGTWIDAPYIANSFVVNVGDMMARWTNDGFASTLHRVINTSGRDRYSMPFFFDMDFDTDLTVLETCTSADRPPRYSPMTGGAYLLERLDAAHKYRLKQPNAVGAQYGS